MAKKEVKLTEEQKRELRLKEIIVETFRQYERYFPQPQDAVIYRRAVVDYAAQAIDKYNAEIAEQEAAANAVAEGNEVKK